MPNDIQIQRELFIRRFANRTGVADSAAAERAIVASLGVLGKRLVEIHRDVVARRLPPSWAQEFGHHGAEQVFAVDDFYRRVAEREGVALGEGMEHAQVVCEVLSELVDGEARRHLHLDLAPEWVALLQPRPARPATNGHSRPNTPAPRRTLSSGSPGSSHPISSASASGHNHSIARNPDPHGDTKLASSRGISTERESRDLASWQPIRDDD